MTEYIIRQCSEHAFQVYEIQFRFLFFLPVKYIFRTGGLKSLTEATQWIERHEAEKTSIKQKSFPKDIAYGYVAADGKFHEFHADRG